MGVGTGLTVTACLAAQPVTGSVYITVSCPAASPVSVAPDSVATAGVVWLHMPPTVTSASVVPSPMHTCGVPVIAAGTGFTVTIFMALQPVDSEYVTVAVPESTPLTWPVAGLTVAIAGALLVQVPPGTLLPSVVVPPTHTCGVPLISPGKGFTVSTAVALHPDGTV